MMSLYICNTRQLLKIIFHWPAWIMRRWNIATGFQAATLLNLIFCWHFEYLDECLGWKIGEQIWKSETLVHFSSATIDLSPHSNRDIQRCFVWQKKASKVLNHLKKLDIKHNRLDFATNWCVCDKSPRGIASDTSSRKRKSFSHQLPIFSPLITLVIYCAFEELKSGMSQIDSVNPIQSTSVAPCVREWVIQFDHAFQVGTGTVNVSMQATGDKMWLFMSQCCHAHCLVAIKYLSWSRVTTNPFPRPLSKMVFIFPFKYWLWYKNPFKSENLFKSPPKIMPLKKIRRKLRYNCPKLLYGLWRAV